MSKLITQFVTCPRCSGMAKEENGNICSECGSIGLGTFVKNDFLYWGYDITPAKIIVRQSRIIFNWAINILLIIIGTSGIASFLWWLKENVFSADYKIYIGTFFSFWGEKNSLILFFWIGILCLLFFYFRYQKQRRTYPLVKFRKYRPYQKMLKQIQRVPNNWKELKSFRTKLDVSKSYTPGLIKLLEKSYALAIHYKHKEFMPIHVVLTVIGEKEAKKQSVEANRVKMLLTKLNIHKGKIGPKMEEALKSIPMAKEEEIIPTINQELRRCLIEGYLQAMDNRHERVGILDLISSLTRDGRHVNKVLTELGINLIDLENAAEWQIINDHYSAKKYKLAANRSRALGIKHKLNQATDAVATPILDHFCHDLTLEVNTKFKKIFTGQEEKITEIFQAFTDKKKSVILRGPAGVGKKTIIKYIAERILDDDVPRVLMQKRILKLDLRKLQTEAPEVSLEEKLPVMILELTKDTNTILTIDNITDDLWRILSQYAGSFYLLGTTEKELSGEGMSSVRIEEPELEELLTILSSNVVEFEDKYKVSFDYSSLLTVANASLNYYTDKKEPAKAVSLLERIAKSVGVGVQKNINNTIVAKFVAQEKNVPYTQVLK